MRVIYSLLQPETTLVHLKAGTRAKYSFLQPKTNLRLLRPNKYGLTIIQKSIKNQEKIVQTCSWCQKMRDGKTNPLIPYMVRLELILTVISPKNWLGRLEKKL